MTTPATTRDGVGSTNGAARRAEAAPTALVKDNLNPGWIQIVVSQSQPNRCGYQLGLCNKAAEWYCCCRVGRLDLLPEGHEFVFSDPASLAVFESELGPAEESFADEGDATGGEGGGLLGGVGFGRNRA